VYEPLPDPTSDKSAAVSREASRWRSGRIPGFAPGSDADDGFIQNTLRAVSRGLHRTPTAHSAPTIQLGEVGASPPVGVTPEHTAHISPDADSHRSRAASESPSAYGDAAPEFRGKYVLKKLPLRCSHDDLARALGIGAHCRTAPHHCRVAAAPPLRRCTPTPRRHAAPLHRAAQRRRAAQMRARRPEKPPSEIPPS
jgi:hypothetical protein